MGDNTYKNCIFIEWPEEVEDPTGVDPVDSDEHERVAYDRDCLREEVERLHTGLVRVRDDLITCTHEYVSGDIAAINVILGGGK